VHMPISSDQADELEALCAIYPDEFETVSTEPLVLKVHLTPFSGDNTQENHVGVTLVCEIPEAYPEVVPILCIEVDKGLGKKHKEELTELVNTRAQDNMGMPMVYVLAELVREWLIDNNIPGQDGSMYAEMTRRMQQGDVEKRKEEEKAINKQLADSEMAELEIDPEEQERVRKRQAGIAVTVESFLLWREKYEEEERERGKGREGVSSKEKISGKQFFLNKWLGGEREREEEEDEDEERILAEADGEEERERERGGEKNDLVIDDIENENEIEEREKEK